MSTATGALRSVAGIVVGIVAITLVVESLEHALVALVNGEVPEENARYWAVRNGGVFLAMKTVHNTAAAVLGGWLTVRIAGRLPLLHAGILAVLQTAGFVYALATPSLRETGPLWMWLALIPLTLVGIGLGTRWALPRPRPRLY